MNLLHEMMERYAALVIQVGLNLQKGQELVIRAPIESAEFVHILARKAYQCGAKEVIPFWKDEQMAKLKYQNCPLEMFQSMASWQAESNNYYARRGAAMLTIAADDPDLLSDVDPAKIVAATKASHQFCKDFYDNIDNGNLAWNIISVPTKAWAKKVFPKMSEEEAMSQLWNAIFRAVRADSSDPVEAWKQHSLQLEQKIMWLNQMNFDCLHFQNSLGTDLTIGLPEHHIWEGGKSVTNHGVPFIANIPTEEVYTAPQKDRIDGIVYSALPLNYNGSLIDDFSFTFEHGKIVDFSAKQGYNVLKHVLDTDEGSRSLGEVALVPHDSPISNMGILFYNTLFDENASCHLALGDAYASSIEHGTEMTQEQLSDAGLNQSVNHIDFMVGTSDMEITGITKDGQKITIFKNGNWA